MTGGFRGEKLGIFVLLSLGALTLSGCQESTSPGEPVRNSSGQITEAADNVYITKVREGDCLNSKMGVGTIEQTPAVPCSAAHTAEVYSSFTLPASQNYPDMQELTKTVTTACVSAFEDFAGIAYKDSKLSIWPIYPSAVGWTRGDHTALCLVSDSGHTTTGTLRGTRR